MPPPSPTHTYTHTQTYIDTLIMSFYCIRFEDTTGMVHTLNIDFNTAAAITTTTMATSTTIAFLTLGERYVLHTCIIILRTINKFTRHLCSTYTLVGFKCFAI